MKQHSDEPNEYLFVHIFFLKFVRASVSLCVVTNTDECDGERLIPILYGKQRWSCSAIDFFSGNSDKMYAYFVIFGQLKCEAVVKRI